MYLHPLEKYFIKTCIKLEEQIKHRKATWLIVVHDFILTKEFYERDAETFIEFQKTYTDRKGNFFHSTTWLKQKTGFPYNIELGKKELENGRTF